MTRATQANLAEPDATVPVYTWLLADGQKCGFGTDLEFRHWNSEGVNPDGLTLGAIIGYEPASEDSRRAAAWAA